MDEKEFKELLGIIQRLRMTVDDVIREAELVEEYGEWYHMSLMGYSGEELRQAAEAMAA